MTSINKNLYGCWKMTAMRFKKPEGGWESETIYGGTSVFTQAGNILTFTRTSEIPFGYSGKFVIEGDDLVITPEVSSISDIEGKVITRTVKKLEPEDLTLGMIDDATGRIYEIDFKLLTSSFS